MHSVDMMIYDTIKVHMHCKSQHLISQSARALQESAWCYSLRDNNFRIKFLSKHHQSAMSNVEPEHHHMLTTSSILRWQWQTVDSLFFQVILCRRHIVANKTNLRTKSSRAVAQPACSSNLRPRLSGSLGIAQKFGHRCMSWKLSTNH